MVLRAEAKPLSNGGDASSDIDYTILSTIPNAKRLEQVLAVLPRF